MAEQSPNAQHLRRSSRLQQKKACSSRLIIFDDLPRPKKRQHYAITKKAVSEMEAKSLGFVFIDFYATHRYHKALLDGDYTFLREPYNPYDRNAIAILNGEAEVVGHVPRREASVLSPLLDSKRITISLGETGLCLGGRSKTCIFIEIFATCDLSAQLGDLFLCKDEDECFEAIC